LNVCGNNSGHNLVNAYGGASADVVTRMASLDLTS
jgi:hypothetical protein